MNRSYLANLSWYRTGQVEEGWRNGDDGTHYEGWRNRDDGTYYAVGGLERDPSLQGVVDTCVATRQSEWGREYQRVEIVITSACARCDGRGWYVQTYHSPTGTAWFVKDCTLCQGAPTDRRELSITL
jgi:hypothetical protein